MNIDRVQKSLAVAVLLSETSHVFCCVLPTLFSILSLAAGLGMIAALPSGMVAVHEMLHDWEVPMILLSGVVIALGWGVHLLARKLDCHNTGCAHGPCAPKKRSAGKLLRFASALFAVNVGVYLFFHHGLETLVH